MITLYKNNPLPLDWEIFKGVGNAHEDFTRALISVFLIGAGNKIAINEYSVNDGVITFDIPVGLREGTYSLQLLYFKNWQPYSVKRGNEKEPISFRHDALMEAKADFVFSVTEYEEEQNLPTQCARIHVKSNISSYGYDGLGAYELSVLRGIYNGTEEEFVTMQTGNVEIVNRLNTDITRVKVNAERILAECESAADDANIAARSVSENLPVITRMAENAQSSAASASQHLSTVQSQIESLVDSPDVDAAVIAKLAENTAASNDNARSIIDLQDEVTSDAVVSIDTNAFTRNYYIDNNGVVKTDTSPSRGVSGFIRIKNAVKIVAYLRASASHNAISLYTENNKDSYIGGQVGYNGNFKTFTINLDGTANYVRFCSTSLADAYINIYYDSIKGKVDGLTNAVNNVNDDINHIVGKRVECTIKNGSNPNPSNASLVHTSNRIEVEKGDVLKISVNRTLESGHYYKYTYYGSENYEPSSVSDSTSRTEYSSMTTGVEYVIKKSNTNFGYVTIAEYDQDDVRVELRQGDFTTGDVVVTVLGKNTLEKRINNIEENVGDGGIESSNGKSWLKSMFNSANRSQRVDGKLIKKPLTLLHFTDIHGDGANLQRIVEILDKYEIDDAIHTGDIVANHYDDSVNFWENCDGAEKILNVVGNHDVRTSDGQGTFVEDVENITTESVVYDKFFAPYIENWNLTDSAAGKCYYYKDYTDHSATIRLIVLDIMHKTNEQITWFEAALADATENGYHVIVAKHCFNGGEIPVECAFTGLTRTSERSRYYESKWTYKDSIDCQPIVQKYIDMGLNFVCYLAGHSHYDCIAVNPSYPKQVIVVAASANGNGTILHSDYYREVGARSQDLFNIVTIEPYNKRIKMFRIGADRDIYLRKIESCVINYGTGVVEYSN